jgi:AraC-like DNA-binding protein
MHRFFKLGLGEPIYCYMSDMPSFGQQLFIADRVDLHAASVWLPYGGSGGFNYTDPALAFLEVGRAWIEMDGFAGWIEGGTLLTIPAGPRSTVALPGTRSYSIGLGVDGLCGRYGVQPRIIPLRGRLCTEWCDRIRALSENPRADRSEVRSALMELLAQEAQRCERRHRGLVGAVLDYLESSLDRTIPLEELGERFSFTPNHLNRIVRGATGRSIRQWDIGLRMDTARRSLRTTNLSVTCVAAALGLESAYFARRFAARYELPPSQWRANVVGSTNLVPMIERLDDAIIRISHSR